MIGSTGVHDRKLAALTDHLWVWANYIMQYANSLIGRQFKTIVQTNIFHVYDIVNDLYLQLTKAVGVFTAVLWNHEIHKINEYSV